MRTLDETRKNIVVIASIALAIIGVTLTYNVHGGIDLEFHFDAE